MRRVIVDFKKLNKDILDLLVTKYPDGYDDDHIITFKNALNEIVECVEVRTDDTIYLVKVSKRLVAAMEDHDLEEDEIIEEDVENELPICNNWDYLTEKSLRFLFKRESRKSGQIGNKSCSSWYHFFKFKLMIKLGIQ